MKKNVVTGNQFENSKSMYMYLYTKANFSKYSAFTILLYITDAMYYRYANARFFPKLTRDRVWGTNLYKVS